MTCIYTVLLPCHTTTLTFLAPTSPTTNTTLITPRRPSHKSKPSKLFQGSQSTFQDQEQQAADLHVVEVYNAFRDELTQWFTRDPVRRNDVEARGDMADYLTDNYLSQKLDPLPPSKVTSTYRKYISRIIEELASSSGNLPANWCTTAFDNMPTPEGNHLKLTKNSAKDQLKEMHQKQKSLEKELSVNKKLNFGLDDDSNSDKGGGGTKRVKFQGEGDDDDNEEGGGEEGTGNEFSDAMRKISSMDSKTERGSHGPTRKDPEEEKERIKKQYELYNRKKKNIESEGKPDDEKAAQSQALQDDIRSLLSTIQTRSSPVANQTRSSMGDGIN